MWKSSVTFHEQNCQVGKKNAASTSSATTSPKGLQKRPKSTRSNRSNGAITAAQTAVANSTSKTPKSKLHSKSSSKSSSLATKNASSAESASTSLKTVTAQPKTLSVHPGIQSLASSSQCVSNSPAATVTSKDPVEHLLETEVKHNGDTDIMSSAMEQQSCSAVTSTAITTPEPSTSNALFLGGSGSLANLGINSHETSPITSIGTISPCAGSGTAHTTPGLPEGAQLPAPSTLLLDKRTQPCGARPPIIPGPYSKHIYPLPAPFKDGGSGGSKSVFDMRVPPATQGVSGAKPPMMLPKMSKMPKISEMPKMPIAMDLGESDEEGPKIVGAQDIFIRTGNPFGGFAPRCSPLPVNSPIVCPGISPMPLSPLAPFSPLPPDSPAHNVPDPVHPPVNQPVVRPINTNW